MQIESQELEYCKHKYHYKASLEEINAKTDEVLNVFKKAPVSGFRKGRAPTFAIKQTYKKQIAESVKRALLEEAYHNIIFEKNIKAVGQPSIENIFFNDEEFTCLMTLAVKPDFTLNQYKDFVIPVNKDLAKVEDETHAVVEKIRQECGSTDMLYETDSLQVGDKAIISYKCEIDGEDVPELSAVGEVTSVGDDMIPGFTGQMIGMHVGETREFVVVIPEIAFAKFANKSAKFTVTLTTATRNSPHPIDESLAKRLNLSSVEEIYQHARTLAEKNLQQANHKYLVEKINNLLLANHDFQIPDWWAKVEAEHMAQSAKINPSSMQEEDVTRLLTTARANIKLSLILEKIREEEPDAQLAEKEVGALVHKFIEKYKRPDVSEKDIISYFQSNGYLDAFVSRIKSEHVLDFIIKTCKFVD